MSLVAKLIEAGTPAELVEEVAMLLAEKRLAEKAIEKRRTSDNARQSRRRNVTSRDITLDNVTERDPSLSLPPNENNSNPPTHTHPDNKPARKGKTEIPAKPDDVMDQVWVDFLDMRKRKSAPLSETALDGIRREASKAGWGLNAALAESVTRGWQAFKAEWVKDAAKPPGCATGSSPLLKSLMAKQPQPEGIAR
jgi:hypothetical protein